MPGKIRKKRKKTKKRDTLKILKYLNRWLFNPNIGTTSLLTQDEKYFYSNLLYRLYSLCESQPLLMIYLNEYMNSFDINKYKFSPDEILETFSTILRLFGISNPNMLYYSKYKEDEQRKFMNLIRQYFNEIDYDYSYRDVVSLYHLFNKGVISEIQLKEIEALLKGKELSSSEKINTVNPISNFASQKNKTTTAYPTISDNIKQLNEQIKNYIKNRLICKKCPLYTKPKVILETNINSIEKNTIVDVAFIGLNPGVEEVKEDRPFVGGAGKIFRSYLQTLINGLKQEYGIDLKFLITNIILCSTPNEQDIPKPTKVINNCRELHEKILKLFNPRFIVLFGKKACSVYNLKGSMKSLNGKVFEDRIIPIVHPSYLLRGNKAGEKMLNEGFGKLFELLSSDTSHTTHNQFIQHQESRFNIPEESILTRFSPDLTLFDITIVNNKLIYILVDSNGKKRYVIEDFKFPVFVKQGNYKDCAYIEENVDYVAYLDSSQKEKLQRTLYSQMTKMVKL